MAVFIEARPPQNPKRKVRALCPKAAGSLVIRRKRVSETMSSACITTGDCYRDFDRRSCWDRHEEADFRERSAEPSSPQTNEFVEIKSRPTVMNLRKNLKAPSAAEEQTEALAILASPNLPSILPMGAFPLTLVALGHVSRRNLDNVAP